MKILISGGSGYLGRALSEYLLNDYQKEILQNVPRETLINKKITSDKNTDVSHETSLSKISITWLSRSANTPTPNSVNLLTYEQLTTTEEIFNVIINLAGAGIADKRWSKKRKQQLFDSRLNPTQALLDYINRIAVKPKLFISGSAIGWYGADNNNSNKQLTENLQFLTDDFAHQLCDQWEKLALTANEINIPVAIIRTGVVLSKQGGMIEKLKLPFSLALGGRLGDGQQIMSWISRDDWVRTVGFIIKNNLVNDNCELRQIYNLTAPNPVNNTTFTKSVGNWLNRPTLFAQPRAMVKLIFGEMATLLVDGQTVYPQKLLDMGFQFKDTKITNVFN